MAQSHISWNGIDLTTLRLLVAACEEENLGKAAARENIAVSALSKRITTLEARFQMELFYRHDRGVQPTAGTLRILPRIRSLFDLLDQIATEMRAVGKGDIGVVRLQSHMTAISGPLPKRILEFSQQYPEINVELEEVTSPSIVHSVQVGACDVGLISGTTDSRGLECFPWAIDHLVAVLPIGHELQDRKALEFGELLAYPFIAMQRDSALLTMYRGKATELGKELQVRMHVTSFEAARNMVASHLGVTILPATAVPAIPADSGLVVRPIDHEWATRHLTLCVRDMTKLSAAASHLVEFLLSKDPGAVQKKVSVSR